MAIDPAPSWASATAQSAAQAATRTATRTAAQAGPPAAPQAPVPLSDVLVLGAGILGASIAYHCAKAGLSVTVVERGEPLRGTSGATFAWLGSHLKTPAAYNAHSRQAIERYAGMEAELDCDLEYARLGSITVALSASELEHLEQRAQPLRDAGAPLELLTARQVRAREPWLAEHVAGGLSCPVDIEINPFLATAGYLRRARERGAVLHYRTPVVGLLRSGGAVRGVLCGPETAGGELRARTVICAAGIDSPEIAALAGMGDAADRGGAAGVADADRPALPALPLGYSRGQIMVTERLPPRLGGFLAAQAAPEAGGFMVRQVRAGNVLLGYTSEPGERERRVTPEGLGLVARNVTAALPALAGVDVLRSYAGIRPLPIDGVPIISEVPGCQGLIFTVMHSGYTLSALLGQAVAEQLTTGDTTGLFRDYGLQRFAGRVVAAGATPSALGSGA